MDEINTITMYVVNKHIVAEFTHHPTPPPTPNKKNDFLTLGFSVSRKISLTSITYTHFPAAMLF